MKLPLITHFNFAANKATRNERLNILGWLGFGAKGLGLELTDNGDATATIALQLKDPSGASLAEEGVVVEITIGDAAGEIANIGDVVFNEGAPVIQYTENQHYKAVTNSNGQVVITFTPTATPEDVHVTAVVKDAYVSGEVAVASA